MPETPVYLTVLGMIVLTCPVLMTIILGVPSLLGLKLREERATALVFMTTVVGLLASLAILASMLYKGLQYVPIELGNWVVIEGPGNHKLYHFSVKLVFDRLSVPFVILSFVLSGTVGAFASKYMHQERGFNRFFTLYAIFVLGMVVTSLAGTIETLFTGWELVGLSSALLVAFFQDRPAPARNAFWVWVIYRFSDAALILAAVAMHHLRGEGDFAKMLGTGSWPEEYASIESRQALIVGFLLLFAAMGKSALVPFSGWLPRAMEGPTPSSAVFYGALSVHLGAFLLLRVSPLIDRSHTLSAAIVIVGSLTALFAYLAGSVQTDIKSALCFASLSQVGVIVAEIGFGLRYIALIHILGHATLRTLQFVRAPTLLHDYHALENAIGKHLPHAGAPMGRLGPRRQAAWLYRYALERGYLDSALKAFVVGPFLRTFRPPGLRPRKLGFAALNPSLPGSESGSHFRPIS